MGNTRHRIENIKPTYFERSKLLYVSTSKYEGDWQSIFHSHPFSELFYVVNGSGSFVAEGSEFPVGKNDMVVINPHVQHTEKSLRTSPLEYIVLGIDGLSFSFENIASAQDGIYMQTPAGAVYKYNTQNANVYAYLNIMLEEITGKEENYETVCQNLLEVLLVCMLRNDNLSIVQNNHKVLNRECTQIKNYLDANYAENITLDTLASLTHMNKYYMAHAFTKYTGLSPINYLLQREYRKESRCWKLPLVLLPRFLPCLAFLPSLIFPRLLKRQQGKLRFSIEANSESKSRKIKNAYIQKEGNSVE